MCVLGGEKKYECRTRERYMYVSWGEDSCTYIYNACMYPPTRIGTEQQCQCDPAGDSCWSCNKEFYWSGG